MLAIRSTRKIGMKNFSMRTTKSLKLEVGHDVEWKHVPEDERIRRSSLEWLATPSFWTALGVGYDFHGKLRKVLPIFWKETMARS